MGTTKKTTEYIYLDRLSGHRINGTCRPDLELVQNHVSQTLVVDHSDVDVRGKFLPGNTGVHWFVPVVIVTSGKQLLSKVVNSGVLLGESSKSQQSFQKSADLRTGMG